MAKHRDRDSAAATVQSAPVDPTRVDPEEGNNFELPPTHVGTVHPSPAPGQDLDVLQDELPLGLMMMNRESTLMRRKYCHLFPRLWRLFIGPAG